MADLPNLANLDYVARVNRAIDHIVGNLSEPLKLEDVARVACFSPCHFHRIFKGLVGETLNVFVKRVRLEKAVHMLSYRQGMTLTNIALACGFSSSSDFSRSFRSRYGVPPRVFDVETFRRSNRETMHQDHTGPQRLARLPAGDNPDGFAVTLRDCPRRRVAYIRVHRPYEGSHVMDAVTRLRVWAEGHGLADGQWLGYQWDDPEVVALDKCRYDLGLEVPDSVPAQGEVCIHEFEPMKVAELEIAGGVDLEMRALDWLYLTWLPASGFVPDDQPGFEAFNGQPFAHGSEYFELRVQLPVTEAAPHTLPKR